MRTHSLTLLEVMLVIAILAVTAGTLVWRLDRWVQSDRFRSDALRLKSLVIHARSLALYTHADWQLELTPSTNGLLVKLACREEPSRSSSNHRPLNACNLIVHGAPLKTPLHLEFYSSGALAPLEPFTLQSKHRQAQSVVLCLPDLFQQKEKCDMQ